MGGGTTTGGYVPTGGRVSPAEQSGDVFFTTEVIVNKTGHVDVYADPGARVVVTIWPPNQEHYVPPPLPRPGVPTMCLLDHKHNVHCVPVPRGESETVGSPMNARNRRRFVDWWASKSRSNDIPDFLRKEAD